MAKKKRDGAAIKSEHAKPDSRYNDLSKNDFLAAITGDISVDVAPQRSVKLKEEAVERGRENSRISFTKKHERAENGLARSGKDNASVAIASGGKSSKKRKRSHPQTSAREEESTDSGYESPIDKRKRDDSLDDRQASRSRSRKPALYSEPTPQSSSSRLAASLPYQALELFDSSAVTPANTMIPTQESGSRARSPYTPGYTSDGSNNSRRSRGSRSSSAQPTPRLPGRSPFVGRNAVVDPLRYIPGDHDKRLRVTERRQRTMDDRSIEDIKKNGGPFTNFESEKLLAFCTDYQQSHRLSNRHLIELVNTENRERKEFLLRAHNVLPWRSIPTIRQALQRRFRKNAGRGRWTKEEDEKLSELVAANGTRWQIVSDGLGRHWEDCRDRYRSYHTVENQKLTRWDDEETLKMMNSVGDNILLTLRDHLQDMKISRPIAMASAKAAAGDAQDVSTPEFEVTEKMASKMLLWLAIARKVPRRSRLQCYMRFGQIRLSGSTSYTHELRRAMIRAGIKDGIVDGVKIKTVGKADDVPQGMRLHPITPNKKGRWNVKEFYGGDRIALVEAIRESRIKRDENIDWTKIREDNIQLRVFQESHLASEWISLKVKHDVHKARSRRDFKPLSDARTRKAAKKVLKWLDKTLSDEEKSLRWIPLRPRQRYNAGQRKRYQETPQAEEEPETPRLHRPKYKTPEFVSSDEEWLDEIATERGSVVSDRSSADVRDGIEERGLESDRG